MIIVDETGYYDFWVPNRKKELVERLNKLKPATIEGDLINWNKFKKRQLMAVFIRLQLKKLKAEKFLAKEKDKQLVFNFSKYINEISRGLK